MEMSAFREGTHNALLRDIDRISQVSRVPRNLMFTPVKGKVSDVVLSYLTGFNGLHERGCFGLSISHGGASDITTMHLIGACLLRNYVDTKVYTPLELVRMLKMDEYVEAKALIIPRFHVLKGDKTAASPPDGVGWLMDLLIRRMGEGRQTIISVHDWDSIRKDYGQAMHSFLFEHYIAG